MKQARDCAAGTVHSRCPGPARRTPARRCHRAGEAWPGALPAPSSQPWVNLLLTSPPCPCVPGTPRTLQTLPGPPGPARPGPARPGTPRAPRPVPAPPNRRPQRRGSSAPRPLSPIGCYSAGHAQKGGASSLPPIRAPRLPPPLPEARRYSHLPSPRTPPRQWIEALSLKTYGGADWSELEGEGSGRERSASCHWLSRSHAPGSGRKGAVTEQRRNAGGIGSGTLRGPGPAPPAAPRLGHPPFPAPHGDNVPVRRPRWRQE